MDESKRDSSTVMWVVSIVVVGLLAFAGGYGYANKTGKVESQVTVSTKSGVYKDGTYSVTGSYLSPGGAEEIGVTLTLKDDAVVDTTATVLATRPGSVKFQGEFVAGYKTLVVGKKLDEINVGKVSGSSLTPAGFNDAVAKIKLQAKA